ncbi:MAG: FkbM family methyltransferase [Bacteroidetes bacterium]|nr:FkbM family methyltransferase [Bacteroidota bacterium]
MKFVKDILLSRGVREFVVVDVGAKDGIEYLPDVAFMTEVHAFEPNLPEFKKLEHLYQQHPFKKLDLHQVGLGEVNGTATFFVSKHSSMSSILKPDLKNYKKHFGIYSDYQKWEDSITTEQYTHIDIRAADDYFKDLKTEIDFLKIDTQGSELSILKGAQQLLKLHKVLIIKVEVSTVAIYENQDLFADIDLFLRQHNYTLVDFITYRNDHQSLFVKRQHHAHFGPCGDAVYVLNSDVISKGNLLKMGILIQWLGYSSLANHYFEKTDLNEEEYKIVSAMRTQRYIPLYKRFLKDIMPPFISRLLKRLI